MTGKRLINPKWFSPDIEEPEHQVLMASRCTGCRKVYFPPRRVCPHCMTIDRMEPQELGNKGKLLSFTVSYVGPKGFETPYAYGWVDLPEGIRLFSLLTDCTPFEDILELDMPLRMVMHRIAEDPDGTEVYGFMYRPL